MRGGPLTIAHRGAPALSSLENTLQGIRDVVAQGVQGVEIDVQDTRDGEIVLFHDSTVRLRGRRRRVSELTLPELEMSDRGTSLPIATLEDALKEVSRHDIAVIVDLKSRRALRQVLVTIERSGMVDNTVMASFDALSLVRARSLSPLLRTGLIVGASRFVRYPVGMAGTLAGWLAPVATGQILHVSALIATWDRISNRLLRRAHDAGIAVFAWGEADDIPSSDATELDVDGVIIDGPRPQI